eukprot:4501681-Pyramimonas_sp.AAC.1
MTGACRSSQTKPGRDRSGDLRAKFTGHRASLIDIYKDSEEGRKSRVAWADVDNRQINYLSEKKVEVCDPDDQLWDYDYYVSMKGDPKKNGLGHVE